MRLFRRPGIPNVHFPLYGRSEAISILSSGFSPSHSWKPVTEDTRNSEKCKVQDKTGLHQLYTQFLKAIYDSLAKYGARDLPVLKDVSSRLWPEFVKPVQDGLLKAKDISRLMIANRTLFQSEHGLLGSFDVGNLVVQEAADDADDERGSDGIDEEMHEGHKDLDNLRTVALGLDIPYYSKFTLCAAYLASHNPPRTDHVFFAEWTEKKKRRRNTGRAGRISKNRKVC